MFLNLVDCSSPEFDYTLTHTQMSSADHQLAELRNIQLCFKISISCYNNYCTNQIWNGDGIPSKRPPTLI